MKMTNRVRLVVLVGLVVVVGLTALVWTRLGAEDRKTAPAEAHTQTGVAQLAALRDPDVPELPFADNPDPSQCGIPSPWSGEARAWLLDLTANALAENPNMDGIAGYVTDSGEGRWTVFEAIDLEVPSPVITLSLMARFISRQEDSFAAKLLAAMRNQFGGHAIKHQGENN